MTPIQIGIFGCILLFIFLITSIPVAFAMIASGIIGFALIVNPQAAFSMAIADLFETFTSYNLSVIPLFVMMGQVVLHSGISKKLFKTAYVWIGHKKGGLAMATVWACAGFGAICGSGPATAATMASVAIPEMKHYGYSEKLSSGTVAAGGSLGMLIPPSVVFIVYAIMTEQSIQNLFLAGLIPGFLISTLFCVAIFFQCLKNPKDGPAGKKHSWKEKINSLNGVLETLILFIVVMGGMFKGFFTPIEASAIGVAGSFIISIAQRQLSFTKLKQILFETVRTSCMIFFIIAGANIFGRFLAISRIPFSLANFFISLPIPAWSVMLLILIFFLIAGCFIDALALILLAVPIFYPVILDLGFNPIWFGVVAVVITQMGVITPPVGVNVYVVSGMERDIPLTEIFRGVMPFLFMLIIAAIFLICLPEITLFLPNLLK